MRASVFHSIRCAVLACAVWTTVAVAGSPAAESSVDSIDAQIERLRDPDPAVRRRTGDALKQNPAARQLLIEASHGDDPQIAQEASDILRNIPWYLPTDSPRIRELLLPYSHADVPGRIAIVADIADLAARQGQPTLLRLLAEPRNEEDVCWQIVLQLLRDPNPALYQAARSFDPATARPSALVLAAHAWLTSLAPDTPPDAGNILFQRAMRIASGDLWSIWTRSTVRKQSIDQTRALAMLSKAVAMETAAPTYDDGLLDFAFDELSIEAIIQNRPNEAVELRRQQCKRIGVTRSAMPSPLFELLFLHATFGPFPGFEDDLKTYAAYLGKPESQYAIGKVYERVNEPLLAASLFQAALSSGWKNETRFNTATFLLEHGWLDQAAAECRETLLGEDKVPNVYDVNAHLRLGAIAAAQGDEAGAAREMRVAIEEHKSSGGVLSLSRGGDTLDGDDAERAMEIEASQHALHAAQKTHDKAHADREVAELLRLGADDPEAVLDLIPELRAHGRAAEAAQLFAKTYDPLRARLDAGDDSVELLNELAWVCARCDEHLAEALDWSSRAVAAEPLNSAYLDTNAEANFRLHHAAEAIRLETLALKQRPNDGFMREQLKRFQKGAGKFE